MIGAIIGDIVGSRFEWNNTKSKRFKLFTRKCFTTDDSIMSLSIAKAILECNGDYDQLSSKAISTMRNIGQQYPLCGYGGHFRKWIFAAEPQPPYGSYGNGAAMRVSACGFAASSLEEAIELSHKVTQITHDHPEGIKGAEATTVAIWLARTGRKLEEIRNYIQSNYYDLNFKLDDIRKEYHFDVTCQGTVPQAIESFLESTSFEDAIRKAIFLGGDSDTLAAIAGGIAEAYYGVPDSLREQAIQYLDEQLTEILLKFEAKFQNS